MVLPVGMLDKDLNIQYLATKAFYNSISSHIEKTRKAIADEEVLYDSCNLNKSNYTKNIRLMRINIIDLTDKLSRLEKSEKNIRKILEDFNSEPIRGQLHR